MENKKELLEAKMARELEEMKERGYSGVWLSIMEDYYNIILLGD